MTYGLYEGWDSGGRDSLQRVRTSELSGIYTYIRIHRWTSHTIGQSHCIATYRKVSLNPSIAAHRTIAAYRSISRNIAEYRGISREIRGVAARSRTIAYHRRPSRDVAGRRDAAPSQDVATPRTIAGARTSRRRLVEEVELGLLPAVRRCFRHDAGEKVRLVAQPVLDEVGVPGEPLLDLDPDVLLTFRHEVIGEVFDH